VLQGTGGRNSSEQEYFPTPVSPISLTLPATDGVSSASAPPRYLASMETRNSQRMSSPPQRSSAKYGGGSRMRLFSDASSDADTASYGGNEKPTSISETIASGDDAGYISGLVTARFKHVVTEDGHAIITGRNGETLQRCEDEPIHIPGAVVSPHHSHILVLFN